MLHSKPETSLLCSTWVMVSLKTRKVAKIPDEMRRKLQDFAPNPPRCAAPASLNKLNKPKQTPSGI